MRVALITDGISPYVLGGMQKHSFYLAKFFAKNKIHVDLFHYNDSVFDIDEMEFFSEQEKKFIHSNVLNFPTSFRFPGHYIFNSYRYSCSIFNLIKNKVTSYDFIYTKGFSGWKLISEKNKGNIFCCKIGVNFHGYEMFQISPEPKAKLQQLFLIPFVKKISQQADVVFSYGGKITKIIQSIGVKPNRIIEIPSGVEKKIICSSVSQHQEPCKKFIFVGRAERRKGIKELNNVLRKLISENLTFKFEFIGPIPDFLKINHQSILYYGEIREHDRIKNLLSKSDILVCPSWSEGFPNVILEGMACGLSIIATNVGAVSSMVNEENGWLIEPGNEVELEKVIKQAIYSADLHLKKEKSLSLVTNHFNWDIISNKLISVLKT